MNPVSAGLADLREVARLDARTDRHPLNADPGND